MANDNWWFKFDWEEWRGDTDLGRCSLESQGFWIRCICAMHAAEVAELAGTPHELARLIGCFPDELMRCLLELKKNNAADVIIGNGFVSVVSRRRQRELKAKEYNRLQVQAHRQKVKCNDDVIVQSKSKSKKKEKEEELREASASPPPAPETSDTLEHHPLISGINAVAGRYPPKEIWDDLTGQVGANVDQVKLKTCFTKWRARGFNPQNFQGWAVDWYLHGIPKINAMEKRSNGTTQPKTFRQQRNDEAKREGEFLEQLRRSVANGTTGIPGNDPADSQRRLLAGVTDADPG